MNAMATQSRQAGAAGPVAAQAQPGRCAQRTPAAASRFVGNFAAMPAAHGELEGPDDAQRGAQRNPQRRRPQPPPGCTFSLEGGWSPVPVDAPCGSAAIFSPVRINATGPRCPSLEGQQMTETITWLRPQRGETQCPQVPIETGQGCAVGRSGFLNRCTDHYSYGGGPGQFPEGPCVARWRQEYHVGSHVVGVNTIVFTITRTGNSCRASTPVLTGVSANFTQVRATP